MPTYEYECTECGEVVELFQPITEATRRRLRKNDPKACDCNAPVKRRIGGGGGIIFKGSGFYQTDYRSESYKKAAEKDKPSSGDGKDKSAKDGGGKSDSGGKSESGGEKKASSNIKKKESD